MILWYNRTGKSPPGFSDRFYHDFQKIGVKMARIRTSLAFPKKYTFSGTPIATIFSRRFEKEQKKKTETRSFQSASCPILRYTFLKVRKRGKAGRSGEGQPAKGGRRANTRSPRGTPHGKTDWTGRSAAGKQKTENSPGSSCRRRPPEGGRNNTPQGDKTHHAQGNRPHAQRASHKTTEQSQVGRSRAKTTRKAAG